MLRLALLFGLIVVGFDAVAAIVSKLAAINYGQFALLAAVVYFGLGIYAGNRLRRWRALTAVVVAALIDASLGWYVAASIGPARPAPAMGTTQILGEALLSAAPYAFVGAVGVGIGLRVARSAQP